MLEPISLPLRYDGADARHDSQGLVSSTYIMKIARSTEDQFGRKCDIEIRQNLV